MSKSSQSGFTLVEIVITIAVFAVILPAIVGMVVSLDHINDRAREQALVHSLAETKAEELRSVGFEGEELELTDPPDVPPVDFGDELPDTLSSPKSANYTVSLADSSNPSLKEIEIIISYNDRGTTRTSTYKTYLGELGVGQY
jgi:prepilin-type N-terminal cleavage/methylation domain-containing protein